MDVTRGGGCVCASMRVCGPSVRARVCVCARVCMRACVYAFQGMCVCVYACACVRVCERAFAKINFAVSCPG